MATLISFGHQQLHAMVPMVIVMMRLMTWCMMTMVIMTIGSKSILNSSSNEDCNKCEHKQDLRFHELILL